MRSELLPDYIEAALEDNEELVPELLSGEPTLDATLEICRNYRVAAIGDLLATGLATAFSRRLHQSGAAYAHFLSHAANESKLTSQSSPFLDAVAAADQTTARLIAQASRRDWARGEEYEEDFLFFDYLMRRFYLGAATEECKVVLAKYEVSLAGTEDPRLDVCRGLLSNDPESFDSALIRYLQFRSDELDAFAAKRSVPNEELATIWHLSVEGVALVRLARAGGMATKADYLHVPSIALEPGDPGWSPDDWRVVRRPPP